MKLAVRRLALAVVPALAVGMAGCGINEQTQRWYAAADGVNAEAGQIGLRNVLVIADDEGRATVVAAFSNRGDEADELVGVVVGDVSAEPAEGAIEIPANGYADVSPETNRVDLDGADVTPGRTAQVEFRFASAPRTTVDALVMPNEGAYAEALPEPPEPADEPTGEPTGAPTGSPGEEPTGEPTGQETPGPTDEPEGEPGTEPTNEPGTEPTGEAGGEPTGGAATGEPTG